MTKQIFFIVFVIFLLLNLNTLYQCKGGLINSALSLDEFKQPYYITPNLEDTTTFASTPSDQKLENDDQTTININSNERLNENAPIPPLSIMIDAAPLCKPDEVWIADACRPLD